MTKGVFYSFLHLTKKKKLLIITKNFESAGLKQKKERIKKMKNFNIENLVLRTTKTTQSATTQAVASYWMFLKSHESSESAIADLRTILKKGGVYTTSNRGAVNKNIATANAIIENFEIEDISFDEIGFKKLCKIIEDEHLTYARFKTNESAKKTDAEKKQAKVESLAKQIRGLDADLFTALEIELNDFGIILFAKTEESEKVA